MPPTFLRQCVCLTLLGIITALWALGVQVWGAKQALVDLLGYSRVHCLFLLNFFSVLVLFSCGRLAARVTALAQMLSSILIGSFIATLGTQPTLSALINGQKYTEAMGLSGLASYVPTPVLLVALAVFLVQNLLIFKIKHHGLVALLSALIVLALLYAIHKRSPWQDISLAIERQLAEKAIFTNTAHESILRRGYIATGVGEVLTGRAWGDEHQEFTCAPKDLDRLPQLHVSDKIVFVQVESLGYDMLERRVDGKLVMPFLHELAQQSLVLRLDGVKKLISANSDYELFNTREASAERLHYEGLVLFPDSIVSVFAQRGLHTSVHVGHAGDYLNLQRAYIGIGFEERQFKNELLAMGYQRNAMWDGLISDADLFDAASKSDMRKPFMQFIITMDMHEYSHIADGAELFSGKHAKFYTVCNGTDKALQSFVEKVPDGTTVVIYGDHQPYYGERSPLTPMLIYVKGKPVAPQPADLPVFTRCEASHYLRKLWDLPTVLQGICSR